VKQGQKVMGLYGKRSPDYTIEYTFGLFYLFYLHFLASIILKNKGV